MRDVTTAPLRVASLHRWQQHQPPAPFISATVENHVSTLIRIHLLEISIQVSFRPTPRHDEDQLRHDRLPLAVSRSHSRNRSRHSLRRDSQKTPRPERRKADTSNLVRSSRRIHIGIYAAYADGQASDWPEIP